jgi:hypothetical protein
MDETQARDLLSMAATTDAPPSAVNVALARRTGRRRLRWRRAGQAGAPAMAAIAVVGIIATTTAAPPTATTRPHRPHHAVTSSAVAPRKRFNPLIPAVAWGWLPDGGRPGTGQLAPTYAFLYGGQGHNAWSLYAFTEGRCDQSTASLLRALRRHLSPLLNCRQDQSSGFDLSIVSTGPRIGRQRSFWSSGHGYLAWPYANHTWALLAVPKGAPSPRAARVAAGIRFDAATRPSIGFPVQLTGLARTRRVDFSFFADGRVPPRASQWTLTGSGQPSISVSPATARSSCYFYRGRSRREVINGYRVVVTRTPQHGTEPLQQVCARHADGLYLQLTTYGRHVRPDAIALFTSHTRLLGTNPAHWTTQPLG